MSNPSPKGFSRTVVVGLVVLVLALAASTGVIYWQLSDQIAAQQKQITQLQTILEQLNMTTFPVYSNSCDANPPPASHVSGSISAITYSRFGIQLYAGTNATILKSGQTVEVMVEANNTLSQPLKAYTGLNWPVEGMDPYATGNPDFPIGVGFYSGYYDCNNITSAQPLSIHLEWVQLGPACPISGCPYLDHVVFQANSANATAFPSYFWPPQPMRLTATTSSYYTLVLPNGTTVPFPYPGPIIYPYNGVWQDGTPEQGSFVSLDPGVYTIAAGATWGQYVLLYFTVV